MQSNNILLQDRKREENRIMTGNSFVDAKRMFKHACAFADCAVFCFKDKNNLIVRTQWYSTPGIANSAFACEVFIKALLVYHGMTVEQIKSIGHFLDKLWNEYSIKDSQTSRRIQESIRNYFQSDDNTLFDRKLKEASNAFANWRYMYEGREAELNLHFLMAFREILRTTCCQQLYGKSWSEFVECDAKWELDVQTQSEENQNNLEIKQNR